MAWQTPTAVIFGLVIFVLLIGVPVAPALGLVGIVGAYLFLGNTGMAAYAPWQVTSSFILTTIPLFVLMGEVLVVGGLSERLYDGSAALVGRFPGGLLHANIFACAVFSAVSGSSAATALTVGTIAIPELKKRGYNMRSVLGSLAGGGTLGILIPPSVPMIVYAILVEVSIGDLFIAGVIPGVMMTLIFMFYITVSAKLQPTIAPPIVSMPLRQTVIRILGMWPVVLVIIVVIGGMYLGLTTPTEAAAVGAVMALAVSMVNRQMSWPKLRKSLEATVKTSTMILFIVIGANILAGTLGVLRVPSEMAAWLTSLGLSRWSLLISIYVFYIFLGCFLDAISMLVLTMPIIYPIVALLGFDPIWFGVALVIVMEMAQITPPVGLNLFALHGLEPERPISEVVRSAFPYFWLMVIGLAIITVFPEIAIWLPSTMHR